MLQKMLTIRHFQAEPGKGFQHRVSHSKPLAQAWGWRCDNTVGRLLATAFARTPAIPTLARGASLVRRHARTKLARDRT